jgi:TatA/E family protein of Tat protein translocase
MFAGHLWEVLLLVILALVVFGPKRLPEITSGLGRGIKEFRRGASGEDEQPQISTGQAREPGAGEASGPTAERAAEVPRDREAG